MSEPVDTSRESLLNHVIAAYLRACDEGRTQDHHSIVARHPSIASELGAFFANQAELERLACMGTPSGPQAAMATPSAPESHVGDGWAPDLDRALLNAPREGIEVGSVFAGRYRIFGRASGGMGRVYFADDLTIGEHQRPLKVAIKSVADFSEWRRTKLSAGADAPAALYFNLLARFRREALVWVRLGMHANIIWAMWVLDHGAKPYLVMEYANGGDLSQWIREGRLTLPMSLDFALQFCKGMGHAVRSAGLVHRDIKPANALIKDDRILKVSDFGLAKAFDACVEGSGTAAEHDYVLSDVGAGTRAYMAPEQFQGLRLADTRSDIFSFGAMLFEMLTGRQLFASFASVEMARLSAPIPSVLDLDSSVPAALSTVVTRCLEYDPSQRFQSFDELDSALSAIHSGLRGSLPVATDPAHERRAVLSSPSLQLLAETYTLISLGRHADALECADRALEIDPANFEHRINKGKALAELKQFEAARDCWLEATRLRPDQARAWANLGWAHVSTGDPAAGLECARRAIEIDRELADAWMCRGASERSLGHHSDAVRSLVEAVRLEPHNWKAHVNLGYCLKDDLEHYDDALDSLTRASKINPHDANCWLQIGWLETRRRSWREARKAFDLSLQLQPSSAAAWAMRAWALWSEGTEPAEARASLRKAFDIDPENQQARIVSGAMFESQS